MKKQSIVNRVFLLLLVGIVINMVSAAVFAEGISLTVTTVGLENEKGFVIIKLFNSQPSYEMKNGQEFLIKKVSIVGLEAIATFNNLTQGTYAIKLYHDENNNDEHDQNFMGIPKEDYAFSNNASGMFGPPDWEEAKFELEKDNAITININN